MSTWTIGVWRAWMSRPSSSAVSRLSPNLNGGCGHRTHPEVNWAIHAADSLYFGIARIPDELGHSCSGQSVIRVSDFGEGGGWERRQTEGLRFAAKKQTTRAMLSPRSARVAGSWGGTPAGAGRR